MEVDAKIVLELCNSATIIIEQLLITRSAMNDVLRQAGLSTMPQNDPPMSIFETMKARAEQVLKEQGDGI